MDANIQKYTIAVKDTQGAEITSGCLVFVYGADTKTLSTIYSDAARSAKTFRFNT